MATLARLPSHSKRGWQWCEGGGKCQQYGWSCQYCQGLEVINRQLEMSFQLPREKTRVRYSSYLFFLGGNTLREAIHSVLLYVAFCESTWLFDMFGPSVLLRNALHLCVQSDVPLSSTVLNRKQSRGSYTILAENGLGNLKRFCACNAFL